MEFKCSLISVDEAVDFYSDEDLFPLLHRSSLLGDHLDFVISGRPANSGYKLFYGNNKDNFAVYTENECRINYPWSEMNDGDTLLYAACPLLEVQRQLKQWLTAYSAAVAFSDGGVLLLGKSGAGKTSVAIDLCRGHGGRLIGNDLTVLGLHQGRLFVKGGTKFFFLRLASVSKSLPDLKYLFSSQPPDPWLCKIKVDPGEIGIRIESSPTPVNRIFLLHVDDSITSLHVQADRNLATKLFLIENFSRYIRGSCINILGGDGFHQLGFVPSFDNEKLFDFRCRLLELVLARLQYISGPLHLITDYIVSHRGW